MVVCAATFHKGGAWFGKVAGVEVLSLREQDAKWIPGDLVGLQALIIAGRGSGQYRDITANTADTVTVDRPWEVAPDSGSQVAIYGPMRHAIIFDCDGSDTSAIAQLSGNYYDMIIDSCCARRDQGIWGLSGWFIQMKNNRLYGGVSFHPGIGPSGINPEGNTPYAYIGFIGPSVLRGTDAPSLRGAIIRNNRLLYNHRVVFHAGYGIAGAKEILSQAMVDVVADNNYIGYSAVGIQLDCNVTGAMLARNTTEAVQTPLQCNSGDVWIHPAERFSYQLQSTGTQLGKK